jgi:hypothetical protein
MGRLPSPKKGRIPHNFTQLKSCSSVNREKTFPGGGGDVHSELGDQAMRSTEAASRPLGDGRYDDRDHGLLPQDVLSQQWRMGMTREHPRKMFGNIAQLFYTEQKYMVVA